jgi:hypothetical protein
LIDDHRSRIAAIQILTALLLGVPAGVTAQQTPSSPQPPEVHEHVDVAGTLLTPTTDFTGTAWLPRATPMFGIHRSWQTWDLRLDGMVFVQYVYEPGDRHRTGGAATHQLVSPNWVMAMARRRARSGRFGLRSMMSADPWTVRDCGALNFLATGEVCEGDTIHDRQQPHDLVMELAVDYDAPLKGEWRWQAYAGLAGEPAFGPTAYPHRPSAAANPIAPISHHWLDANHIAFGVATVGFHNQSVKAEASIFNGRSVDEERTNVDFGAFDSASARVSFLPTDRLSLQLSVARVKDPLTTFEGLPDSPTTRISASGTYVRASSQGTFWVSTVAVGVGAGHELASGIPFYTRSGGGLIESSMTIADRHTLFGRAELAVMPGHHLHANEYSGVNLTVAKLEAGYVRQFAVGKGLAPGIGGTAALSLLPPELAPRYSGSVASSFSIFFVLRPVRHAM